MPALVRMALVWGAELFRIIVVLLGMLVVFYTFYLVAAQAG